MKLLVISDYRAGERRYQAGQEIDMPDAEAAFVMRDSPGSFVAGDAVTEPAIPSVDRRQRGGRVRG